MRFSETGYILTGSQCKTSITSSPPDRGLPDNHACQEDTVFVTNNKQAERQLQDNVKGKLALVPPKVLNLTQIVENVTSIGIGGAMCETNR